MAAHARFKFGHDLVEVEARRFLTRREFRKSRQKVAHIFLGRHE